MGTDPITEFFYSKTPFQLAANEICIRAEERASQIFFLEDGVVKQTFIAQSGQELCLNLYKSGSFFPLMDGLADIPNQYTFAALTDSTGYKAPVNEVKAWLQTNPEVSYELSVRLLKGLHGMLLKTASLMEGNARALIVQTLLTLSQRFPTSDNAINLVLTHQKLANLTGLSRETVTRELTALKQLQLVSVDAHEIMLLDRKALFDYV
ncbi:MAG: Crp/Fnr family transcriptional regulator [Candidatus Woesebacteria bacterium]